MDAESKAVKLIIGVVGFMFLLQLSVGLAGAVSCAAAWALYYGVEIGAVAVAAVVAVVVPTLVCSWVLDLVTGSRHAERWIMMITNSGRVLIGRASVSAWLREAQKPSITIVEEMPESSQAPEPPEVRRVPGSVRRHLR